MTPCDVCLFLVAIDTAFQRPKMASLLGEEVFETRRQAPAPSKDFCQLLVTRREVGARGLAPPLSSPSPHAREGRQLGPAPAPEAAAAVVRAPWGAEGLCRGRAGVTC